MTSSFLFALWIALGTNIQPLTEPMTYERCQMAKAQAERANPRMLPGSFKCLPTNWKYAR